MFPHRVWSDTGDSDILLYEHKIRGTQAKMFNCQLPFQATSIPPLYKQGPTFHSQHP